MGTRAPWRAVLVAIGGLALAGCGDVAQGSASRASDAQTLDATGTGPGGSTDVNHGTGETDTSSGGASQGGSTSDAIGWTTGDSDALDEAECAYTLVHEQPGAVLWVHEDDPFLDLSPLAAGEGFYCMRVEFDMQTLDNLDALAADHGGCPEYTSVASLFGTSATGDVLATAFFHHRSAADGECAALAPHAEVGNYLHYTADVPGPWPPGQAWHVVLEAKPWLTRLELSRDGAPVGPRVEADLFPANVEDSRDPVVRLGQPMIVSEKFFPWFGATYANLEVWADVAPP